MQFGTATPSQAEAATSESFINDLLGADLSVAEEVETQVAEDTSVTEPDVETEEGVESEVVEGDDATELEGDEPDGEEEVEEEAAEEEFNLSELETDYAESAYSKAAQHYQKTTGKQLDPNDKADRALLKELMDRGRKISELQSKEPEEEPEEEATEEQPAATTAQARTPEQMLQERVIGVKAYAKEAFNPAVAKEVVLPMMQAIAEFMYPGKGAEALSGRSEQQLRDLSEALTAAMAMQIADAVPQIVAATPGAVAAHYPYFVKSQELAENQDVLDTLMNETDKQGNPMYPGLDKLVNSEAINKHLQSPELKNAVFNKDPFKNKQAKLKVAYRLARNERVDPQMLANASKRGRAAEQERQKRVAAGRTSPGNSNGRSAPARFSFLNDLVGNGEGSRSAQLFKNVGRREA